MAAIRSLGTLNKNARAAQKNLRKVSTGERINAKCVMRNSLTTAVLITHYAFLIPNCSSCAVANIVDILRTLKQKAIDSANDSNTDDDRRIMQKEVDQLIDQIDDTALVTFNGKTYVRTEKVGDYTLENLTQGAISFGNSSFYEYPNNDGAVSYAKA